MNRFEEFCKVALAAGIDKGSIVIQEPPGMIKGVGSVGGGIKIQLADPKQIAQYAIACAREMEIALNAGENVPARPE